MKKLEKPSTEAKALSLFLMAYKTKKPIHKEESKRINRLWDLVVANKLGRTEYNEEIQKLINTYGGYEAIVEKTVKFYIKKTGSWKLEGKDKYCQDAAQVAEKILSKKKKKS